jgi:hypothetical protein
VTRATVWAYEPCPEAGSSSVPEQHLTGAGGVLELCDACCGWSEHNQLAVHGGIPGEYEMHRPRFDTSGCTQLHPANRGGGASDLGKSPLHAERGPGSAAAVVWAVEEE